MSKSTEW